MHQGSHSLWVNLLPSLPASHEYILYSFDTAQTARLFPQGHFLHRRIPVTQPHFRILVTYPWMARRDGCRVFHVNYFGPPVGAPGLVVSMLDLIYLDFPQYAPARGTRRFRTMARLSARAARRVITISEYSKSRIVHHFGIPPDRINVVYPGLDQAWFAGEPESLPRDVRTLLPGRFLLAVGRYDLRKNVLLAAKVAGQLKREGLVDGLVVIGPDDFGLRETNAMLSREGLTGVVTRLTTLAPHVLRAVYAAATVLLYPSYAEGFGYPIIEAMATGLPAIVSNRTAMPEVAGNAALVVDPDNARSWISATRSVLTDPHLRDSLRARGRARAGMFTATAMADATVATYLQAAEGNDSVGRP